MAEQGSEKVFAPMSELPTMDSQQYTDYCASLASQVLDGKMSWDEVAELMFGEEPTITYTRWTAA